MANSMGTHQTVGDFMPVLKEGRSLQPAGVQQVVSVPMGPPLLVDGATYKQAVFVAPCNGCYIKEIHISSSVACAGGTSTLAVSNYDASANSARNVLSTTNIDLTTIPAVEGLKLTLSTTKTNLMMDEGDVLNFTLVCGTQTTNGEGLVMTAIVIVPDLI